MEKEVKTLKEITDFFKRTNRKIKLIKLISQAKLEYDSFDFKSGYKTLLEGYKLDKKNPTILRGLGCIKQFNKEYDEAISFYKKALKYSLSKEIEYTLIGTVYYLQDNLDKAVEFFNLAISENDNYEKAFEGRNQAMLEQHVEILDLQESLKKYF